MINRNKSSETRVKLGISLFIYSLASIYHLYRCIIRTAHNFHCDCDNPSGWNGERYIVTQERAALCRWETMCQRGEGAKARGTRTMQFTLGKFSNFAQIISRQAECAKMKLAVVPRGVSQLQQYLTKFTTENLTV